MLPQAASKTAAVLKAIPKEYELFCKIYKTEKATGKIKNLYDYGLRLKLLRLAVKQSPNTAEEFSLIYKGEEIAKGDAQLNKKELDRIEGMSPANRKVYLEILKLAKARIARLAEIFEEVKQGLWIDKDHFGKKVFSTSELESFVEIEL